MLKSGYPFFSLRDIMREMQMVTPILPLKDKVVMPKCNNAFITVGRTASIRAVQAAEKGDKTIILLQQRDTQKDPSSDNLHRTGVLAKLTNVYDAFDGSYKVFLHPEEIVTVKDIQSGSHLTTENFIIVKPSEEKDATITALLKSILSVTDAIKAEDGGFFLPPLGETSDTLNATFLMADTFIVNPKDRQSFIECKTIDAMLEIVLENAIRKKEALKVEKHIQTTIVKNAEKAQKEYYLHEKLEAINKELGTEDDLDEMIKKAKENGASEEAIRKMDKENKKLKSMNPMSGEAAVIRNFIETVASMPWGKTTKENLDTTKAKEQLDKDQYGLEKVKTRILEQLAVQQINPNVMGSVICLAGPPGVAKTSIAKSIAKAQNREFIRVPLGGVRDEAEIRGHRRTYLGSMPGKIIAAIKKANSNNPMILLDEIDKMGSDHKGDPAAALLEVLDPSQNKHFQDHFMDIEYDISKVLFFATANYLEQIPRPLLDRMEIITVDGYSDNEKLLIAKNHLIPKTAEEMKLPVKIELTDDAITLMISEYTMESGVRKLEQLIRSIFRKVAYMSVNNKARLKRIRIDKVEAEKMLGNEKIIPTKLSKKDMVGRVMGLAYTQVGGDVLPIDCLTMTGMGGIELTGQLGSVMTESAKNAITFIKHNKLVAAKALKQDMHIHAGDGSTPKDGPSAGVALVTVMVSALTNKPIRRDVAMTGEITIRGEVCAIGGVKEKLTAAARAGITKVYLPKDNEKDVTEELKGMLKIQYVESVLEILKDLKLIK